MAWYPVKSGGTATGDTGRAGTQPTGSFATLGAANYYDNIRAAMDATTAPTSGDSVICSDLHSHNYGVNTNYNGPTSGSLLDVMSVSDTNMDQYSSGAAETSTDGFDLFFIGRSSFTGIDLTAGDDFGFTAANAQAYFTDCTVGVNGTNDVFRLNGDGGCMVFNNAHLMCSGTSASVDISNACYLGMTGGSVITGDRFLYSNWDSGGGMVKLYGTDLSQVDSATLRLVGGTPNGDDIIEIELYGCEMSTLSPGFTDETFTNLSHKFVAFNCSDTSAAAEYQFYVQTMSGIAEDQDDTGIHRDESTAFDGGTKVSVKATSTATALVSNPMVFDLPARFAALSSASTDTIRVYFAVANTATLTDTNCWAELIYPDGTNKHHFNLLSNRNADIIAVGTTHTDDSAGSTWKNGGADLTAHNEYRMDLDTSGDVGADGVPIIRIYLAEPSITVYFDVIVDVVA